MEAWYPHEVNGHCHVGAGVRSPPPRSHSSEKQSGFQNATLPCSPPSLYPGGDLGIFDPTPRGPQVPAVNPRMVTCYKQKLE